MFPGVDRAVVHHLRIVEHIRKLVDRSGRHLVPMQTLHDLVGLPLNERVVEQPAQGLEVLGLGAFGDVVEPRLVPPWGYTRQTRDNTLGVYAPNP